MYWSRSDRETNLGKISEKTGPWLRDYIPPAVRRGNDFWVKRFL